MSGIGSLFRVGSWPEQLEPLGLGRSRHSELIFVLASGCERDKGEPVGRGLCPGSSRQDRLYQRLHTPGVAKICPMLRVKKPGCATVALAVTTAATDLINRADLINHTRHRRLRVAPPKITT
jgi:hypothetical protein